MNQRTDQLERTRTAIVDAAAEFLSSEADPREFTMQAVADRAGVSHRTLYRHFEDRQDLIDAAARHWEQQVGMAFDEITDFDQWTNAIAQLVAFGVTHREVLRRGTMMGLATGVWRSDRDKRYWRLFRERFPHLDMTVARQDFALLRHTLGAANVLTVGERFDLSPAELTQGMQRAVEALVASIAARDRAASKGEQA